jgi:hypothetical protein
MLWLSMLLSRSVGFSSIMGRRLARVAGVAAVARRHSIIGHAIRRLRRALVRPGRGCVCLGSAIQRLGRMSLSDPDRAAGVERPLDRRLHPLLAMGLLFSDRSHPTL